MPDPVASGLISYPVNDFGPAMKGMVIGGLSIRWLRLRVPSASFE